MTRFYFALVLLLLMGVHEVIVAMLGANVVGFTLPPVTVFELIAVSPFILILANGLPSLFSLLPGASREGSLPAITANVTNSPVETGALAAALSEAITAAMTQAYKNSAPPAIIPAPASQTAQVIPAPIVTQPPAA